MKILLRTLSLILILALYGCATPVTKEQITPDLYSVTNEKVNLAVIDHREYVLSGDKSEKFEGIIRGAFGIPITVDRPKRPEDERFVDYLSGIIKDGFYDVGIEVHIIKAEKGISASKALKLLPKNSNHKSIIIIMNQSKWDAGGFKFRYLYNFDFHVADKNNKIFEHKQFYGDQADKPSDKYNLWDMYSIIYRNKLESIFKDDAIKSALLKN